MFLGEYEYKVDAKGRVPLPPKFRKQFTEGIVLNLGPDGQINGYTQEGWSANAEQLDFGPINKNKHRELTRALFSSAFDLELDSQGRIMLPPALRQGAGIEDSLVIIGANKCIEIWSSESWNEAKVEARENLWQHLESMEPER
jgi:MraZ protein